MSSSSSLDCFRVFLLLEDFISGCKMSEFDHAPSCSYKGRGYFAHFSFYSLLPFHVRIGLLIHWICPLLKKYYIWKCQLFLQKTEWMLSPLVNFNKSIRIDVRTLENIKINIPNVKCWMVDHFKWIHLLFFFWCWMQENVGWKFFCGTNFIQHHPTWLFSSFMKCWIKSARLNRCDILLNIESFACWMNCWTR